ncbi:uncharacterized protein [Ptychodera flava]|uniref:uncharacterized protein n=1 Tax=Ptychodera flava TaxID=63121 RepID=UPI003969FE73
MAHVYYTLPNLRYSTLARFIFFADAVTCVTLWLTGGHTHYMEDMIIHFKLMESVFELACLALLKLCILFFVFIKLEKLAMEEIEDPYNPKRKRNKTLLHVFTILLTFLSLAYTTTKGVLVLVNKTYNEVDMHSTYIACCIAAFAFSLIEFLLCLLYPVFLRKLKVFRIKHQLNDEGEEVVEGENGQPKKKKANLGRVLSLVKL